MKTDGGVGPQGTMSEEMVERKDQCASQRGEKYADSPNTNELSALQPWESRTRSWGALQGQRRLPHPLAAPVQQKGILSAAFSSFLSPERQFLPGDFILMLTKSPAGGMPQGCWPLPGLLTGLRLVTPDECGRSLQCPLGLTRVCVPLRPHAAD